MKKEIPINIVEEDTTRYETQEDFETYKTIEERETSYKEYAIYAIIIVATSLTIGYFINSNIEKSNRIELLKIENLKESDEEIIIKEIKQKKENISNIEDEIKEKEYFLDITKKEKTCLNQQLNRLVEGLEYSLDYCKNGDNLDKFQGLD